MKKEGNKKMPTPRQKVIHNPIPSYIFVSFKTLPILCMHSIYILCFFVFSLYNSNSFEHNKDVGMGL